MPKSPKTEVTGDVRRRGRPIGKNRVPLSQAERRARNAQYERERRNKTADAMAQLAEAVGCNISTSTSVLLASVIARLQRAQTVKQETKEDIEKMRRRNKDLMQEIAELERYLCYNEVDDDKENLFENHDNTRARPFKRRNIRNNIKHETLNTNEELEAPEHETFERHSYSDNRDSNLDEELLDVYS